LAEVTVRQMLSEEVWETSEKLTFKEEVDKLRKMREGGKKV